MRGKCSNDPSTPTLSPQILVDQKELLQLFFLLQISMENMV
jgi:hypothetical protein